MCQGVSRIRCWLPTNVQLNVYKYFVEKSARRFAKGHAGCYWLLGFLKRNPEVKKRKAQRLNSVRANKTNKFQGDEHFEIYYTILEVNSHIDRPERIVNVDKIGCRLRLPKESEVFAKNGGEPCASSKRTVLYKYYIRPHEIISLFCSVPIEPPHRPSLSQQLSQVVLTPCTYPRSSGNCTLFTSRKISIAVWETTLMSFYRVCGLTSVMMDVAMQLSLAS